MRVADVHGAEFTQALVLLNLHRRVRSYGTERLIVRSTETNSLLPHRWHHRHRRQRIWGAEEKICAVRSPDETMYRLRGVRLILDGLALVGCCGGAAIVRPVHAGRRLAGAETGVDREGSVRLGTDTGRDRTASVPAGDADPELLVVGGDSGGEKVPWSTTMEPEKDV